MRITEERIRAAAEATLEAWPAASAVLLFGSRARGDHRPYSDWDLAVVTEGPSDRPRDLPLVDLAALNSHDIDLAFINGADIYRNRNRLGRLGCALARDAKPIAGSWQPPTGLKEPTMDQQDYCQMIANSLEYVSNALRSAFHGARTPSADWAQNMANRFVNRSADAAEHLAKAMLVRSGYHPRSIHDLERLAANVAAGDPVLAEKVGSLNGRTKYDHTRHYHDAPAATEEDVAHATRRMERTGRLLAEEMPHWRNDLLNGLMEDIRSFADDLRDARVMPLNETTSDAARSAQALRDGRAAVLRGADALSAAWSGSPEAVDTLQSRSTGV